MFSLKQGYLQYFSSLQTTVYCVFKILTLKWGILLYEIQ